MRLRVLALPHGGVEDLLASHVQLVLQMEVRARDEHGYLVHLALDARLHVSPDRAARGEDRGIESRVRDELDAAGLLLRDHGESDVHDVHAHLA